MIGLVLATCIAAHQCSWTIIAAKENWTTIEQCEKDVPALVEEMNFVPSRGQALWRDELTEE